MTTRRRLLALTLATASASALPAASAAPVAKVSGPLKGGRHGWPFFGYLGDLGGLGYAEEEWVLEGDAAAYRAAGAWEVDGRWSVTPTGAAAFRTRLLVRRPTDAARFNGCVIVEWMNVSSSFDIPVCDLPGVYEAGFAHVGVSAQYVGVHGVQPTPRGLRQWDPERYGDLWHPGDEYAFDIFSRAGRAVGPRRPRNGAGPLRGLRPRRLIGTGASQSAAFLTTYANAIQPRDRVFDALVLAVGTGQGPTFDAAPVARAAEAGAPRPADGGWLKRVPGRIRDDLKTPVMIVNSETETPLYAPVRQPDTDRFRMWEVAGAAHVQYPTRKPIAAKQARDFGVAPSGGTPGVGPTLPPPTAMSHVMWSHCLDAAFRHVDRWITHGVPPPSMPRIELSGTPPQVVRDELGMARGGVRLPDVEAPIARNDGVGNGLLGHHEPFAPEVLRRLYPTHADYVAKVEAAARRAEQVGVLLPRDAQSYVVAAQGADVPGAA